MKYIIAVFLLTFNLETFAQNDRPSNALPSGSYKNSCSNCEMKNGHWLICGSCKNGQTQQPLGNSGWENDVSLDISACPNGPVWNDHGQLRCGNE